MTEAFLKAKHWQLFFLSFGIPMFFQGIFMANFISNIESGNIPDPSIIFNYMPYFSILMILFIGVLFGWFWSVAIGLQAKLPEGVKMKVKKFKILFFIPMMYILFFIVFFNFAINNIGLFKLSYFIIIPLHLFSMFCIFYCLYFVAKTFKTVALQRETSFSDFAGEFFMIWFYPFGIWVIQPQINKMMEE